MTSYRHIAMLYFNKIINHARWPHNKQLPSIYMLLLYFSTSIFHIRAALWLGYFSDMRAFSLGVWTWRPNPSTAEYGCGAVARVVQQRSTPDDYTRIHRPTEHESQVFHINQKRKKYLVYCGEAHHVRSTSRTASHSSMCAVPSSALSSNWYE